MNAKHHIKRVTLVGAGNVAHNFGKAFRQAGYLINEIYSRTTKSAVLLSQTLNCNFITDLSLLNKNTDLIVISVNDDALPEVLDKIKLKDIPIVHTSGSNPIDVFKDKGFKNYGIFYPVQSFSKNETESLIPIPICVEGCNRDMENLLLSFASSVTKKVYVLDSEKRKALHVAAIFANNFTNHLYHVAHDLLNKHKISFEIIRPIIEKTSDKIKTDTPKNAQTGPAVRNDNRVIEDHLNFLSKYDDYKEIYRLMTDSIKKSRGN